MNKRKIRVGILFGGRSAEHEVSLQSAKNVFEAIDTKKYDPVLVGIDKRGKWHIYNSQHFLQNDTSPKNISLQESLTSAMIYPWEEKNNLVGDIGKTQSLDVVFPVLHGPYGEDGTVQGLLKLANIPCVGASVLGSAIGMDKDVMKRLLRDAQINVANFLVFHEFEKSLISFEKINGILGLPFFIKPANLGSSIGVSKITDEKNFKKAITEAFLYDTKILIEQFVNGREVECAVLGNQNPQASAIGEIVPNKDFYSYEAKYIDEDGAKLIVPADLDRKTVKNLQKLAIQTFQTLCCSGMARVDFFLTSKGEVFVNEINTIPGFTKISMYPKLWQKSGIGYTELIDRLITLAIEKHEKERNLKTTKD